MAEAVVCQRCGQEIAPAKVLRHINRTIQEKNLERFNEYWVLCPKCRRETFANQLIGDRLDKVDRVPHVSRRRKEDVLPVRKDERTGATVYKSECFICNSGCDATVWVKDGKVIKVEGDPSSHVTKGTLCSKGLSSKELLYHPDRLLYPLQRVGKRGEGKWQRISWDEALDTMTTRFNEIEQKYGKDSIICTHGTSRGWFQLFIRFANAWGKQWMGAGVAQCAHPRISSGFLTFGTSPMECPDYSATKCMLVWAANPAATWNWKAVGMMEAWARGAKLIVIDPVLSETASKADIWLRLRPGTDAALALGMLNVIINEQLYDKEFDDKWCFGFESLRERVQEYPPDKVEKITWVPAEQIIEVARIYATTKPGCITQVLAIDQNADTVSSSRSIAMLASITGNIDVPGGNIMAMYTKTGAKISLKNLLTAEQHAKRLGSREYPVLAGEKSIIPSAHNLLVWQAILTGKPYPIRAMYNHGHNMVICYPNSKMALEALLSLDFLVVTDLFMTPTAEIADIVLPAASWIERSRPVIDDHASYDSIHLQQKVVQRGECWSDYKILNELAKKLGFADRMFDTEEDLFDFLLEDYKITWQEFKEKGIVNIPLIYQKYEKNGFNTPSGKIEIYSNTLAEMGFDPLPSYREPVESPISTPELARKYPLILTTGAREPVFRHSEMRNIPALKQIWPDPKVKIHPQTAKKLDIGDGETVVVETLRGEMEARAWFREDIDPGVVQVPSHWPGKQNANLITDNENCAPMIGSAPLRCELCLCKIRKRGD